MKHGKTNARGVGNSSPAGIKLELDKEIPVATDNYDKLHTFLQP